MCLNPEPRITPRLPGLFEERCEGKSPFIGGQIVVNGFGGAPSLPHGQDNGGGARDDVASCKDTVPAGLAGFLVHGHGTLARGFGALGG